MDIYNIQDLIKHNSISLSKMRKLLWKYHFEKRKILNSDYNDVIQIIKLIELTAEYKNVYDYFRNVKSLKTSEVSFYVCSATKIGKRKYKKRKAAMRNLM